MAGRRRNQRPNDRGEQSLQHLKLRHEVRTYPLPYTRPGAATALKRQRVGPFVAIAIKQGDIVRVVIVSTESVKTKRG
jgi:hypothetical protein